MLTPDDPPPRKARGTFLLWIFLVLIAFMLGFAERSKSGWVSENEFELHVGRIAFGAPFTWLVHTSTEATGSPPRIETLPEGDQYLPGFHVSAINLGLDLALAAAISLASFVCLRALSEWMARRGELPTRSGTIAVLVCGVVVGGTVPTEPSWIGVVMGLAAVPLTVIVLGWHRPSILANGFYIGMGVLSMCLAQRITVYYSFRLAPFSVPIAHHAAFSVLDDLVAPVVFAVIALVAVLTVLTVRRMAMRRMTRTTDVF